MVLSCTRAVLVGYLMIIDYQDMPTVPLRRPESARVRGKICLGTCQGWLEEKGRGCQGRLVWNESEHGSADARGNAANDGKMICGFRNVRGEKKKGEMAGR